MRRYSAMLSVFSLAFSPFDIDAAFSLFIATIDVDYAIDATP